MNRKLALNFRKMNDSELDEIATYICADMTGNEDFPDLQPLLPPLQQATQQFKEARRAAAHGDTQKIIIKNDLKEKLIPLLRELGELVAIKANGDELLLIRSGFMFAKPPQKASLEKPEEFQVLPGKSNGEIILQVKRVKGAKAYIYQYTPDPLTDNSKWISITSTKRKIVIYDLPLGVKFLFQVAAIGSRNQIVYSQILGRHIA